MSKLKSIIEYINNTNTHFRTKDVKNIVNGGHQLYENAVYTYITQLYICEYIDRINTGLYIKIKDIPTDLTSYRLAYMAYDKDYRLVQERKKKINKLMNNDKK